MIKDLVVHLTGSDEDRVRLAYAERIARQFNAHVTGLFVHLLPEIFAMAEPLAAASVFDDLLAESKKRADAVTDRLNEQMSSLGIESDLRRLDVYPGSAGTALAAATHTADLFLGTRPYGDPTDSRHVEEAVLFQSGRACLFLPPGGIPPARFGTILLAWNDSRESARAVAEALPFLQQASEVIVGLVEEDGASEQFRIEAGADIGRHLSRHGVSAEIRKIGGWSQAGAAILNEAELSGAHMLVMGGYGHSRFREFVMGGATRHILSSASIPVLMAH